MEKKKKIGGGSARVERYTIYRKQRYRASAVHLERGNRKKKKRQKRSEPDGKAEKATARSSGFKGMPGSDVIGCGGDYVLCRVPSSSVLHLILVFFYPSVIFFCSFVPLSFSTVR